MNEMHRAQDTSFRRGGPAAKLRGMNKMLLEWDIQCLIRWLPNQITVKSCLFPRNSQNDQFGLWLNIIFLWGPSPDYKSKAEQAFWAPIIYLNNTDPEVASDMSNEYIWDEIPGTLGLYQYSHSLGTNRPTAMRSENNALSSRYEKKNATK